MRKGGKPTPEDAGKTLEYRALLWDRLQEKPEGSLFKAEDILGEDTHMIKDFNAMRDFDYIHIKDGWLSAIKETTHLRMLPHPPTVAQNWLNTIDQDDILTEFGDWTAWRMGLYPWEPIAGYRFRCATPGIDTILVMGHMRIKIETGPHWLRDESEIGKLLRALNDMPHKTLRADIVKWLINDKEKKTALLKDGMAYLAGLDKVWEEGTTQHKYPKPSTQLAFPFSVIQDLIK